MISHAGKEGIDWVPSVTPESPVEPVYFFGCKTVKELSEYYRRVKKKRFAISDMVAAVACSNVGFSDYPILGDDWPKVQLAIALLGVDEAEMNRINSMGVFTVNCGHRALQHERI